MVVIRLKLSIGRRVGHIQLCLSEEGAESESPERTTHNRLPKGPVLGLSLFILTRDVGRVSVEGEKVLVGVENFFSDFACFCGRKKELRKPSG